MKISLFFFKGFHYERYGIMALLTEREYDTTGRQQNYQNDTLW
jgi:hypothetical protein